MVSASLRCDLLALRHAQGAIAHIDEARSSQQTLGAAARLTTMTRLKC
jgi:hypothetical protein